MPFVAGVKDKLRTLAAASADFNEDGWLDLIVSPIKDKLDVTVGFRGLARDWPFFGTLIDDLLITQFIGDAALKWTSKFNKGATQIDARLSGNLENLRHGLSAREATAHLGNQALQAQFEQTTSGLATQAATEFGANALHGGPDSRSRSAAT